VVHDRRRGEERLFAACALRIVAQDGIRRVHWRTRPRRCDSDVYVRSLGDLPGLTFMPEAPWGRCTRWLTVARIDPVQFGVDRETVRLALEAANIEARPVWKPMHLPPVFQGCEVVGGAVAEALFRDGLCHAVAWPPALRIEPDRVRPGAGGRCRSICSASAMKLGSARLFSPVFPP